MSRIVEDLSSRIPYPVFNNQWLLRDITSYREFSGMEFMVTSVELPNPFPEFETEQLATGISYYTSVKFDRDWSFTISETLDTRAFSYIEDWVDRVFDRKNHVFNLSGGTYTRDFYLELYRPESSDSYGIKQNIVGSIADSTNKLINSVIGRLEERVSQLLAGKITGSNSPVSSLVHRASDYATGVAKDSLGNFVSSATESFMSDSPHEESVYLAYTMNNTILKSVEKISLEYGEGEPIQWKISLSSDEIKTELG